MPRGIDDQGTEVMIERAAITFEGHVGGSRELADFVRRPGQEAPLRRVIMVCFPIGLQHARAVNFCVEGNREEVPVSRTTRQRTELTRRLLKILRQTWAKVRNRTTREEER